MFLVGAIAGAPTGRLVEEVGYGMAFALSAAAGLPGMILLLWLPLPKGEGLEPPAGATT
jgi:predicted MFS family arabinose efflux permease